MAAFQHMQHLRADDLGKMNFLTFNLQQRTTRRQ